MDSELIKKIGLCCISLRSLQDCNFVNMVELKVKAKWKYPTSGNILEGTEGFAVALVHDDFVSPSGQVFGEIKYAIEFKEGEEIIIYHSIDQL